MYGKSKQNPYYLKLCVEHFNLKNKEKSASDGCETLKNKVSKAQWCKEQNYLWLFEHDEQRERDNFE